MSVKIKTVKGGNFGNTVNFSGNVIKFDRTGVADVSEDVAKLLISNYPGWLFYADQMVEAADAISTKPIKEDGESLKEISKLKEKLALRESTIESLKKELEDWKGQVDIYKGKYEECSSKLNDHKEVDTKVVEDLKLENQLLRKNVGELQTICKELSIEEIKYKGLNKDKLIELILKESK